MDFTIDQALKHGIEAHKAGRVQEADRLYTAILKAQPKHSDANHNMGVLAVGVGKVQEALPFFKTALEANPATAQFWLSYINALIKLNKLAEAKAMLDQAKSKGAKGDGFDQLEQRLKGAQAGTLEDTKPASEENQAQPNILDTLKLDQAIKLAKKKAKDGFNEEAKRIYKDILVKFPKNKRAIDAMKVLSGGSIGKVSKVKKPTPNELQALVNLYNQGELQQALHLAEVLLQRFPGSSLVHNVCGAIHKSLGQLEASVDAFKKAIAIQPDYADAWNNIGSAFRDQGKLEEAIDAYKKALLIRPESAEAFNNMGNALKEQAKLEEATLAYKKAIAIQPDYAEAYNNLGIVLMSQGKSENAIVAYNKAINLKPDYAEAYNNLGNCLKRQVKLSEAIEAYKKALAIKPDYVEAEYILSALSGETTNTAPRKYVENLFDDYAVRFEHSLVDQLEYHIPKTLAEVMLKQSPNRSLGSVLDLGCGTGLTGTEVRRFCENLEGIDLSNSMLDQARKKNVYDKLTYSEIVEYLSNTELNFDYFISTDVFIYVGNLAEVFRLIRSKNKRPGKLAFSTEHTEKNGFHLEKTGRYTHSRSYIEGLCTEFKYTISHFSTSHLRKEQNQFLTGGLYILDF